MDDITSYTIDLRWAVIWPLLFWIIISWQGITINFEDPYKPNKQRLMIAVFQFSVIFSMLVLLGSAIVYCFEFPSAPKPTNFLYIFSIIIYIICVFITNYCFKLLKKTWAIHRIDSLQRVDHIVDNSFYSLVRHPFYSATILMFISVVLIFPYWWNFIALVNITTFFIFKSFHEDQFLSQYLPGYKEYKQKVPFYLMPRIW